MLFILPGMGADARMYPYPWTTLKDCHLLNWPFYQGEKTLSDLAERMIFENNISRTDSVVGSSLGGMVALEIACKLNLDTVFLFGSAVDRSEINPVLRQLAPIAKVAPIKFFQRITAKIPNAIFQMFGSSDPDFIRAMCAAINEWRGYNGAAASVIRIHGDKDRIIGCRNHCHLIKGGGHLISMTHAQECVTVLKQCL